MLKKVTWKNQSKKSHLKIIQICCCCCWLFSTTNIVGLTNCLKKTNAWHEKKIYKKARSKANIINKINFFLNKIKAKKKTQARVDQKKIFLVMIEYVYSLRFSLTFINSKTKFYSFSLYFPTSWICVLCIRQVVSVCVGKKEE